MEVPPEFFDVSPENDKGVMKKIIKEGYGEAKPMNNSTVYVHYIGTFFGGEKHGEKFDSSRDRDERFSFCLGEGQVIKAWDIGIKTMKKGEIAEFICASAYAYGSNGSGTIPGSATLKFEVELFEWKGKDISPNKDGSIVQTIITEGSGWETPKECGLVKVDVKTFVDEKVVKEESLEFEVGDAISQNIIPGIEIAVKKMKKGEVSIFDIEPVYAYGESGNPEKNIPANCTIQCEITLKEFEKVKESYSLESPEEKLKYCEDFKTKATEKFKAGRINYAISLYEKACSYIEYDTDFNAEDKEKRNDLLLSLRLNLGLCYLKIGDAQKTMDECNKALEIDNTNEKGLYRLGQAFVMKGEYESAKLSFQKVVEVNKENKQALNQIKTCDAQIREHLKKEKALYKSMFSKIGKDDQKPTGDTKNGDVKVQE